MPNNEENYPEWLTYLQGESPLLRSSESMFIADIRSQIINEIKSEPKISTDEDVSLKEKLSFMEDNFKQVVKYLKENQEHRQYFMGMYPKWRKLRDGNIGYLKKIAKSIQETRKKCQVANFIGSCVSLIGGGICLASGARSNGLARIDGNAMIGIGAVTSFGSSVAEIGILHGKLKEVQKILKEDEECSKHLWDWLSDNSHLQRAMDNIRYIDVEENWKFAANAFQDAYKKDRKKTELQTIIKKMLSSLCVPRNIAEDISDVIGILIATSMLYDRYRPLFNLAYASVKTMYQLRTVVNVFRSAVAVNSALNAKDRAKRGALTSSVAAGMVLDLVNIFLIGDDLTSKSGQAEKVIEASAVLEKEAKLFELLYDIYDD